MTLSEFIEKVKDGYHPKKIKFQFLTYELEGEDNQKSVWQDYRHAESDGCYDLLSRYCLTPEYLKSEVIILDKEDNLIRKELFNILDLATCDDTLFNDGINLEIEACAKRALDELGGKCD